MKSVIFTDPNGEKRIISDANLLKSMIIDDFMNYWMQGSGDGYIDFYENDMKRSTLMIGPNIKYGLYLHYIDHSKHIDLLSLYDENKLTEVAETAEEIYASIGLFLPIELAWEGIMDFIETGKASPKIEWITPEGIPEDGNW